MGILNRIKEIIVNKLVAGIVLTNLHTLKLVDKGNTLYVDIADFDHNASDGSPTESQMWYNSTDHVLRYRNDVETVDIGAGGISYALGDVVQCGIDMIGASDYFQNTAESYVSCIEVMNLGTIYDGETIRTRFAFRSKPSYGEPVDARIYRNDGGVGTVRSTSSSSWQTHDEDISGWSTGDDYQLWYKTRPGGPSYVQAVKLQILGDVSIGDTRGWGTLA